MLSGIYFMLENPFIGHRSHKHLICARTTTLPQSDVFVARTHTLAFATIYRRARLKNHGVFCVFQLLVS